MKYMNNTAPTYILAFSAVLASVFPDVGTEAFNVTLNTLWIIGTSIVIMIRQILTGRSNLLGGRPS